MSVGSTELITGVGLTAPAKSAGAGLAGVEAGAERRRQLGCRRERTQSGGQRLVVKVGGAVAAESASRILGLVEEGHEVVVIHGAGPQITQEMRRLGIPVEFVAGRRRTSRAALDVVRASFVEVNAELCAQVGPLAEPVFGDESGLYAVPVPPLGWVGDPLPCRPPAILAALAAGRIPVVAPLAVGPLNVNADDAAAALALGLGARRLVFLTDVPGLYVDDQVVEAIDAGSAHRLIDEGAFDGGIVPKLRAAAIAAASGITAHIGLTAVTA
jgi:acetylglutamate kinase